MNDNRTDLKRTTSIHNDIKFPMRLQVYLAKSGIASRRKSEELILAGRVSVNGKRISDVGTKVFADDEVQFDDKLVKFETRKVYVLLNKPKAYLCAASDTFGRPLAVDLLKDFFTERLYNVGRLDLYSNGAIIFTNDGDFAQRLSHPSSEIEKEYFVETVYPFSDDVLQQFVSGVKVDGLMYTCKSAERLNKKKMRITLIEGKNREIRRVLNHFGIKIRQLTRIRIGSIRLGNLAPGKFRSLSDEEVKSLVSNSLALNKQN